jgi:hypothetical protein
MCGVVWIPSRARNLLQHRRLTPRGGSFRPSSMRVLFLAAGAMTLCAACSAAEGLSVPWCPLAPSSPEEKPRELPSPCIPFAQILEEAKRKAREAERRDEEEMSAMRSLVEPALAKDNQHRQGALRREVPLHVAAEPPKRPPVFDPTRPKVQKAARPAPASKPRQAAQGPKAAELRRARARVSDPVLGTGPTLAPAGVGSAWPVRVLTIRQASGIIPIIPLPKSLRPTTPPAGSTM